MTARLPLAGARLGALAVVAFVAACGQAPAGSSGAGPGTPTAAAAPAVTASVTATPVRTCPPSGLLVTHGPVDGAMGLRAVTLRVTNCGLRSYTVTGYPEVGVLDDEGRRVPVAVTQGTEPGDAVEDPGPRATTLRRGESVAAALLWRLLVEANGTDSVTGPLTVDPGPGQDPQVPGLLIDLGTTRIVTLTAWHAAAPEPWASSSAGSLARPADGP